MRAEYGRLLTEAYELGHPQAPADELAYYLRAIERAEQPVLEAMSGSGRFLVPLLERGIDADGMDASADMLAACRAKCSRLGLSPRLFEQRLHELDLPRRYGLIFLGGGSMGLVGDMDELRAGLRRMGEHLLPGGELLIEIERPPKRASRYGLWHGRWWTRPNGDKIVNRTLARYDPETTVETAVAIYELYVDGALVETELNEWIRRFWEPEAFTAELSATGLEDIWVTRALSDEPAADEDETLSIRCRRAS